MPFSAREKSHHRCKKYWLLARRVRVTVPGALGVGQVPLTFLPDTVKVQQNDSNSPLCHCLHLETMETGTPKDRHLGWFSKTRWFNHEGIQASIWSLTLHLARRVFSHLPFPPLPFLLPHQFFNSGRMSVSLGLLFDIVLLWNPISFDKCQKGTHSSVKWAEPRANLSLPPPRSSFVVLTNTVCPELVRPWWP